MEIRSEDTCAEEREGISDIADSVTRNGLYDIIYCTACPVYHVNQTTYLDV